MNEWLTDQSKRLEALHDANSVSAVQSWIKKLKPYASKPLIGMRFDDGTIATTEADNQKVFQQHLNKILEGSPKSFTDLVKEDFQTCAVEKRADKGE